MRRARSVSWLRSGLLLVLAFAGSYVLSGAVTPARAVPAFAQQTGYPCAQCHVGAEGPQLTAFGRMFKIRGYSIRGGDGLQSHVPLALWMQWGFEHYNKSYPTGDQPAHYVGTNDIAYLDAVSFFLAGGWQNEAGVGFGAFIQATYDNTAKQIFNDNTDIKVTDQVTIFGKDAIVGMSLNNGPGVSDPWNDNGIWAYPYIGAFFAPGGNASLVLDGGVFQGNTWGVTAYTWFDQSIYAEAGLYNTESPWMLQHLGEGSPGGGLGASTGPEPYIDLVKAWFWGPNNAHIGTTLFYSRLNPANPVSKFGVNGQFGHNSYYDLWINHGYQYLGEDDVHEFAFDGYLAFESENLRGYSNLNPNNPNFHASSQPNNNLQHWHEAFNYFYRNTYGINLAYDRVWGKRNQLLYNNGLNDSTGSVKGSPDTTYWLVEADWVPFGKEDSWARPFVNVRFGLQYYIYTRFNGGTNNYDGFGRNASDNNTLFLYAWTVF